MPRRKKIALIGAGNIGGELAALVRAQASSATSSSSTSPRRKGCRKGKALDLEQNGAVLGYDAEHHAAPRTGRTAPAPTS